MHNRRSLLGGAIAMALVASTAPQAAFAAENLKVVASFSTLGDFVRNVGGDRIALTTLVGPDGDAHVFQPTPADARSVANAQVMIVNGLKFEGWIERLVSASGYQGPIVVATDGITPIKTAGEKDHDEHEKERHGKVGHEDKHHAEHKNEHDHDKEKHAEHKDEHGHDHGEFDPHAWHSVSNAQQYVRNIAKALAMADPEGAAYYRKNAERYLKELIALEEEVKAAIASLPQERRKVVTSHDAFGYFATAYGIEFFAPVGMSTESEASAADVANLIRQIKKDNIPAFFVENVSDPRLIEQIGKETGAVIGGTLYSDALSGPDGPASTYLKMMRHNANTLKSALGV